MMSWLFLVILADATILFFAYTIAVSGKFYTFIYRRLYLRKYAENFSPDISIFIPCKGMNDHLEENIYAFLKELSHKAKLFFIVESEQDPAYSIIKKFTDNTDNINLVVAGLASSCGQKNHNLLQGIKAAGEQDDVYVFLDSFTTITDQQLRDLIRPLSDPKVTVAVGFRWNILSQKTLGERLHAFMIALQWSIMNCALISSVWGGATAIRRQDFENLEVGEYWAKTVVDDMSLQNLLQRKRKTAVFVPTCVKDTNNTLTTIKASILWFKRQVLYVKFYLRPYWFLTLGLILCCAANIISFPLLLLYSIIYPGKKIVLFTTITGVFNVFAMGYCLLLKRPAHDNHSNLSWFLLSPLYLVLTGYACLLGMFTKVMCWRGVSYHLDDHGYVKKIVRSKK